MDEMMVTAALVSLQSRPLWRSNGIPRALDDCAVGARVANKSKGASQNRLDNFVIYFRTEFVEKAHRTGSIGKYTAGRKRRCFRFSKTAAARDMRAF